MQTLGQSCVQSDSRTIEKRETGFPGCALACVDSGSRQCEENLSIGEVGSDEKSSNLWEEEVLGGSVIRKPGIMFVPPSVVAQNVKRKLELDLKILPKPCPWNK